MRVLCLGLVMVFSLGTVAEGAAPELAQRIPLPDGNGRIDHLALDAKRQRLFVAELGNDTMAVVDLEAGKLERRITGVAEPQGVVFLPEFDRVVVSSAESGSVGIFDGASLRRLSEVDLGTDADNVRYDPAGRQVWVGYGNGALAYLGAADGKRLGDITLDGHPEAFQLETAGSRIFVNVPDAGEIAVVDRAKRSTVAAWRLEAAGANFPMALDEPDHWLIVATRRPAGLLVFDTATGKQLAQIENCRDADDVFYDADRRKLYVSCGEGVLDVLALDDGTPRRIERVKTASGARTSLFVPEQDRIYVAVPHRGAQQAEILVYRLAS